MDTWETWHLPGWRTLSIHMAKRPSFWERLFGYHRSIIKFTEAHRVMVKQAMLQDYEALWERGAQRQDDPERRCIEWFVNH